MGGKFPHFGDQFGGMKKKRKGEKPKKEKGGKSDRGEKGERRRKEKRDFPSVSTVEARRSEN